MIFCCFGQNCQCWTNYTCMPHIISSGLSQNKMTDNKLILKCHILQLWLLPYRGKQIVCVRAFYCQVSTHDFVNWKSLKEFPTDKVKQKKYKTCIWFLVYNFTICQWLILRLSKFIHKCITFISMFPLSRVCYLLQVNLKCYDYLKILHGCFQISAVAQTSS